MALEASMMPDWSGGQLQRSQLRRSLHCLGKARVGADAEPFVLFLGIENNSSSYVVILCALLCWLLEITLAL